VLVQAEYDRVVTFGQIERQKVVVVALRPPVVAAKDAPAIDEDSDPVVDSEQKIVPARVLHVQRAACEGEPLAPTKVEDGREVEGGVARREPPMRFADGPSEAGGDILALGDTRTLEGARHEPGSEMPVRREIQPNFAGCRRRGGDLASGRFLPR
jgi:hypothetical protein